MIYDQIKNKLSLEYESLGEHVVKNIPDPVRVYRIQMKPKAPVPATSVGQASTLVLPDKPSIAVLHFTNMSGDPEQEYFSDGITEDLITDLSKLSGLFVIARNSVFIYKGTLPCGSRRAACHRFLRQSSPHVPQPCIKFGRNSDICGIATHIATLIRSARQRVICAVYRAQWKLQYPGKDEIIQAERRTYQPYLQHHTGQKQVWWSSLPALQKAAFLRFVLL
jgi:hypothetical protein